MSRVPQPPPPGLVKPPAPPGPPPPDDTLRHLSVLRLAPGDALVFLSREKFSAEVATRIRIQIEQFLAAHGLPLVPVLVLDDGAELGIMRGGEASR